MFKNNFAGSGQITPKKKQEQQRIMANQGASISARNQIMVPGENTDLRITSSQVPQSEAKI